MELKTNVIEFNEVANENFRRKINADEIKKFESNIIMIQGMIIEMYANHKNLQELMTEVCLAKEIFHYNVDCENVSKVIDLAEYKFAENKQVENERAMGLAA